MIPEAYRTKRIPCTGCQEMLEAPVAARTILCVDCNARPLVTIESDIKNHPEASETLENSNYCKLKGINAALVSCMCILREVACKNESAINIDKQLWHKIIDLYEEACLSLQLAGIDIEDLEQELNNVLSSIQQ